MKAGQIFYDPNFIFHDGDTDGKLFVILNDGQDGSYLAVLTTSQQHKKHGTAGCHVTEFPSNFHFPAGTSFPSNTWLILNSVYEFDCYSLVQKYKMSQIRTKSLLPTEDLIAVLDCIVEDQDLSDPHEMRLRAFRDSLV